MMRIKAVGIRALSGGWGVGIKPIEVFTALYKDEYTELRAIAHNILKNREDADDVMQSVMLRRQTWNADSRQKTAASRELRQEKLSDGTVVNCCTDADGDAFNAWSLWEDSLIEIRADGGIPYGEVLSAISLP